MAHCRSGPIITLLFQLFICGSFSQDIRYSRSFPVISKSVPLAIINRHEGYFHLLRSNRLAHDFTVERRAKPGGQMLAFAALRLDSVNAHWFDYEDLDYLFFEKNDRVFFVFERVQNSKSTLFLKYVDTSGKAGPFIEIAGVEKDRATESISMEWRRTTDDNIIVVTAKRHFNGTTRREATLYDVSTLRRTWKKLLPLETHGSGRFTGFNCNARGDLYFLDVKAVYTGGQGTYRAGDPVGAGQLVYEHIGICAMLDDDQKSLLRYETPLRDARHFNSLVIEPDEEGVELLASVVTWGEDPAKRVLFVRLELSRDLGTLVNDISVSLDDTIARQLDFYDGTDHSDASEKLYSLSQQVKGGNSRYIIMERKLPDFHKELLAWRSDLGIQRLVPRKILYFSARHRFRSIGQAMHGGCGDRLYSLVLEHPANERIPPSPFNYHGFSKLTVADGANAVCYSVDSTGRIHKQVIYRNRDFQLIPLQYESNRCDFVFYLARGAQERFGLFSLEEVR